MDLTFDGVTPVPRMLMISEFLHRPGYRVVLNRPMFVAAGDRITVEDRKVVVTRANGERTEHPTGGEWICRRR